MIKLFVSMKTALRWVTACNGCPMPITLQTSQFCSTAEMKPADDRVQQGLEKPWAAVSDDRASDAYTQKRQRKHRYRTWKTRCRGLFTLRLEKGIQKSPTRVRSESSTVQYLFKTCGVKEKNWCLLMQLASHSRCAERQVRIINALDKPSAG